MAIFIYSLWWGGIALELLLLIRAVRTKLRLAYPIFYFYILFVLTQSFVRLAVHPWDTLYSYVYWGTEFIGVIIGCGIVYEIYRVGLAAFPGTARMARLLLTVLFVMALAKALVDVSSDPRWWAEATTVDIERAMRTVQAAAILALAALFLVYNISFGRNLKGILLGYGLFIGVSVVWFTFLPPEGYQNGHFWAYLGPISYDLALCLWAVYLWSPQAQPVPVSNVRLE
ncbi:MAG: hypothetical protein ABLT11_06890, partial [Candidatus Acidiferrum sp.]